VRHQDVVHDLFKRAANASGHILMKTLRKPGQGDPIFTLLQ
jgi:hypothetical protein